MPTGRFYNTTNEELTRKYERKALKQETIVLSIFEDNDELSKWMVMDKYPNKDVPPSSIGRALNTLYKENKIIRLEKKRIGRYGRPEYIYKLNK